MISVQYYECYCTLLRCRFFREMVYLHEYVCQKLLQMGNSSSTYRWRQSNMFRGYSVVYTSYVKMIIVDSRVIVWACVPSFVYKYGNTASASLSLRHLIFGGHVPIPTFLEPHWKRLYWHHNGCSWDVFICRTFQYLHNFCHCVRFLRAPIIVPCYKQVWRVYGRHRNQTFQFHRGGGHGEGNSGRASATVAEATDEQTNELKKRTHKHMNSITA